jgi:NUMOD4 motif/HNH endonuclease
MARFLTNEKWKKFSPYKGAENQYAVSNHGRLMSFTDKIENGRILKGSFVNGFKTLSFKLLVRGKKKHFRIFVHRLVAEQFIPTKNKNKEYVIHLDHDLGNNKLKNLKWATYEEMVEHKKKNPAIIESQKRLVEFNRERPGAKLTRAKVVLIKEQINNPKRKSTLKEIAEKFDISEMQLYRIKSGENWSHVKVKKKK